MRRWEHGGDTYGCAPGVLDFSISLNPRGTPLPVLEAARAAVWNCAGYPDPLCRRLREAVSRRDGIPAEWILFGNGASDLISRLLLSLSPKQAVLLAPTFSEYRRTLERLGCGIREVSLQKEDHFRVTDEILEVIRPGVDLVFLCDPNNPTGGLMDLDLLNAVLARCREAGAFLAVDQCFLELTGGDPGRLVSELEGGGLFLLRALTKSYALAGLRLGYGLCANQNLLTDMERCGPAWPVSVPAQAAGFAALQDFPTWPTDSLPEIETERGHLRQRLEAAGLWVCPSRTNFLLFQGPPSLKKRLLDRENILIRDCANYRGLGPGWFRVGLRTPEENRRLADAIERQREGR